MAEDEGTVVVETVKRADAGLSMATRWATVIVVLVGFGITIGTVKTEAAASERASVARFDRQDRAFEDFKTEVRGRFQEVGLTADGLKEMRLENAQLRRELDQAKTDVAMVRDIHNADNAAVREKIVRLEAQTGRK